jgi:hypothetical protein
MKENQNAIEVPGEAIQIGETPRWDVAPAVASTKSWSAFVPFEQVSQMLSRRPLRRPNRTVPHDPKAP